MVDRVDHLIDDLGLEVVKNFGGWNSFAGISNYIKKLLIYHNPFPSIDARYYSLYILSMYKSQLMRFDYFTDLAFVLSAYQCH